MYGLRITQRAYFLPHFFLWVIWKVVEWVIPKNLADSDVFARDYSVDVAEIRTRPSSTEIRRMDAVVYDGRQSSADHIHAARLVCSGTVDFILGFSPGDLLRNTPPATLYFLGVVDWFWGLYFRRGFIYLWRPRDRDGGRVHWDLWKKAMSKNGLPIACSGGLFLGLSPLRRLSTFHFC